MHEMILLLLLPPDNASARFSRWMQIRQEYSVSRIKFCDHSVLGFLSIFMETHLDSSTPIKYSGGHQA
jgi:hypothetical protein